MTIVVLQIMKTMQDCSTFQSRFLGLYSFNLWYCELPSGVWFAFGYWALPWCSCNWGELVSCSRTGREGAEAVLLWFIPMPAHGHQVHSPFQD